MTKFTDTLTSNITSNITNNLPGNITGQIQTATTAVNDANSRMLDSVVEANRTAVDFAVKSADRLPTVELPVEMPTPAEAGKRYIDFVERAVEMNRDLNARVVGMLPADIKPKAAAKKTAAKKTAKTATKK